MKQQFAAKHPWTILAAGAAIQVLTGLPAAWGVFQQPVMEEYGLSEQGAGYAFALLIAAFDGSAGGTRYTVEYAMRQKISIVDLPIL